MWGYRSVRWRWWGSVAARFDDVANWLPARITAVLLGPVPWPAGHARPVGRLARTAAVTSSPNAGWPMAAVALRWDLRLAKPGAYTLNPTGRVPVDGDIAQNIAAVRRAALLAAIGAAVCGRATT